MNEEVVDFEHTLIKSGLWSELVLATIKKSPLSLLKLVMIYIKKGKDESLFYLLDRINPDPSTFPLKKEVLEWLKKEKEQGKRLILATMFDIPIKGEKEVFPDIFDSFIKKKNSHRVDKKNKTKTSKNNYLSFKKLKAIVKALRLHQWVKNLLIFLPIFLAHEWQFIDQWITLVLAFFSFGLVASSVYVLNDMWDVESDRKHIYKKNRPFAAGSLTLFDGLILFPLLLIFGFAVSLGTVNLEFTLVLITYWFLTTSYTFYLKRKVLLDVLILAGLYTIRIFAGAVAVSVVISEWLMGFSLFFFLSLALIKRYTELKGEEKNNEQVNKSRGYIPDELPLLMAVGISSGLMSVLVFALYISNPDVAVLYENHSLLWFVAPLLLYWIIRIWKITHRGYMHDDPIVFAIKDKISLFTGFLIVLIIWLSSGQYFPLW